MSVVNINNAVFKPSVVFAHISIILLDIEERSEISMRMFQGRDIDSESSGENYASMCRIISNDTNK